MLKSFLVNYLSNLGSSIAMQNGIHFSPNQSTTFLMQTEKQNIKKPIKNYFNTVNLMKILRLSIR